MRMRQVSVLKPEGGEHIPITIKNYESTVLHHPPHQCQCKIITLFEIHCITVDQAGNIYMGHPVAKLLTDWKYYILIFHVLIFMCYFLFRNCSV